MSFRGNRGRGARGRGKPRWSRLDLSEDRTAPSSPLNYTPPVRPSAATSHANTPNYIQEGHTMANQSDATSTPSSTGSDWSDIQENSINIEKLRLLCATRQEQKKQGYVLEELSDEELVMKMRCAHCHIQRKKIKNPFRHAPNRAQAEPSGPPLSGILATNGHPISRSTPRRTFVQKDVCFYHSGTLLKPGRVWSCCMQFVSMPGCEGQPEHTFDGENDQVRSNWQYHRSFTPSPVPTTNTPHSRYYPRAAVALDCEMGYAEDGEAELIRLTAVDFFTQETLLDNLISPSVAMKHFNTKYSGVTPGAMTAALRKGTCFHGRDAARDALFRFIGPETVIVVHGGNSDLTALRWLHPHIVDTFILEGYHGAKTEGGRSLKNLIKLKKDLDIQTGNGHDSLEDALACRELAILFMETIPDE